MAFSPRGIVLVVCADDDAREICTEWLGHFGFDVVDAEQPSEVLALARTLHPDVVVTSHPTYASPGVTVTALLRNDAQLGRIPVLNLVRWDMREDLTAASADGASESLIMPVALRELVIAVRRHARRVRDRARGPVRPSAQPHRRARGH